MNDAIAHLRSGSPGAFDFDLRFDLEDLDRLLAAGLHGPTFRLLRGDQALPPADWAKAPHTWGNTTIADAADPALVVACLRSSATLALDSVHRQFGPAAALNRELELALSARSKVDLFVVPAGGSAPPVPPGDTLLLGLSGTTRFQVGEATVDLAPGQGYAAPGVEVTPLSPEGLGAFAVVSVTRISWREVLLDALEQFDDPLGHHEARLSVHEPKELTQAEREHWEGLVERFVDAADAEDALNRIATRLVKTRLPYLPGSLRAGQFDLQPNTWVARRPDVAWRIHEDEAGVHLVFNGSQVTVIHKARHVLEFVVESPAFCPAQLPSVPEEQRVPFVRGLLTAGLLALRE